MTLPPAREEWGEGNPDDGMDRGHKRLLLRVVTDDRKYWRLCKLLTTKAAYE